MSMNGISFLANDCSGDLAVVIGLLVRVIKFLQILIPIALILWGTIDMGRAVIAGDEKKIKERQKPFIWRLVSAVIVFLIPYFVTLAIGLFVDDSNQDWKSCWKSFFENGKNQSSFKVDKSGMKTN